MNYVDSGGNSLRFRGDEVHVLEVGVYSGGSLKMWHNYFGPHSNVYGVDIQPSCKAYENDGVRVFIGDQGDRQFWKRVKKDVPVLHIVIDDGAHIPDQQIVTLEELLPHLQPSGVYVCEDVHHVFNEFTSYVLGLSQNINSCYVEQNLGNNGEQLVCKTSKFQSNVASIHHYPFMTVIERAPTAVCEFIAPKHGTEWNNF